MKIDLDDLERRCNAPILWRGAVAGPPVTLALIARIRELEATIRGEIGPTASTRNRALQAILERGAVLP
jgi:hypothetical protein